MPRHLPYSLKPELVRGCTMRCVFCALKNQSWAEAPYEYMEEDLWRRYCADVAGWRPKVRVEIANRGEPTIHPEFIKFIRILREAVPPAQILVSTNGDLSDRTGLEGFRDWVDEAQDAGVNCFLLDCYTPKRLREFTQLFEGRAGTFFDGEAASGSRKVGLNPYPYRGPDWKALSIKDATPKKLPEGERKPRENVLLTYHNQGGNAVTGTESAAGKVYGLTIPDEPLERMCVRPFREFPMWYDGSVPICCDDWADKQIIGKFPDRTLAELWDAMDPFRKNLIARNRGAQKPCDKCTENQGKRFGLELSWFGQEERAVIEREHASTARRAAESAS